MPSMHVNSSKYAGEYNAAMQALHDKCITVSGNVVHNTLLPKLALLCITMELRLLRAVAFINGLCNSA